MEFRDGAYFTHGKNAATGDMFLVDGPYAGEPSLVWRAYILELASVALLALGGALLAAQLRLRRRSRRKVFALIASSLIAFLCLGVPPALAGEFPIAAQGWSEFVPVTNGESVLYFDVRAAGDYDVWSYDIGSDAESLVAGGQGYQMSPEVYGDFVIWHDNRNGNWDLYGRQLSGGPDIPIVTSPADQVSAQVGERYVVWSDFRNTRNDIPSEFYERDIYAFDRSTGQEVLVSDYQMGDKNNPAVGESFVVWQDSRNGYQWDIYARDLAGGDEFALCSAFGWQVQPAISGNIVVWMDSRNGNYDIYGYDVTTGQEFPICTDPGGQNEPDVWGNVVVWIDYQSGDSTGDIFGYDLASRQKFQISSNAGDDSHPRIVGDLVVWERYRVGYYSDIYGAYIPEPASMGLLAFGGALLAGRPKRRWRRL